MAKLILATMILVMSACSTAAWKSGVQQNCRQQCFQNDHRFGDQQTCLDQCANTGQN